MQCGVPVPRATPPASTFARLPGATGCLHFQQRLEGGLSLRAGWRGGRGDPPPPFHPSSQL
eukprot:3401788-Lingulodinium_polyedra.AAC.1